MYACTDFLMNGTVTMDTIISIIDTRTFEEAKAYFKLKCGHRVQITSEDDFHLSYTVPQDEKSNFTVHGRIENKHLPLL